MGATAPVTSAAVLSALAQPTRLKIIEVLADGDPEGTPAGVIARRVECPASTLSFHLKELAQAGLLEARPRGRFILYAVVPGAFAALAEFIGRLPGKPESGSPAPKPPRGRTGKRKREEPLAATEPEAQLSIF
ncbi:MAG: metalloregulator ArsR/SmtB family transcription factor [Steroidobacteraceae bacterium]|jgi:DNA-binding transcriptional ArsR family regulator|nr:metalloregulator ArsR/SmtB family transcription factor [Steroidobacteraceae bacterium]